MSDIDEIRLALNHLNSHDRDLWVRMGAAIKDELGEQGFEIWDTWSQQSDKYNPRDARATWKSIRKGHVHIGSLYYEARQAGYVRSGSYTPPSAEEVARRKAEAEKNRQAEEKLFREKQQNAERSAQQIWQRNLPASANHPYLVKKGITESSIISQLRQGMYKGNDNLIIPVLNNQKIVSLQFINQSGEKRFLSGGRMQGSYTIIGDSKRINQGVVLAEGVATAASINQATGYPVIVAFNAGNLRPVAEQMKQVLNAETSVIIAADNDVSRTGINHAKEAASLFGNQARVIMPEFTEEQIAIYQEQHGQNNYPSDFNDLHALAGLDRVKQVLLSETVIQSQVQTDWPKPNRTPWDDFPPVIRNGSLGDLKKEAQYKSAKSGDKQAALELVTKLITSETIAQINEMINGHPVLIVPVSAIEASGNNQIPLAMAAVLSKELDSPVDHNILQANKVNRTDAGIDHRLAYQPLFTGEVKAGQEYLLVDDTLSVGSTIANLRGYIETNGGKVIGAAVMTAHEGALNIAIKPEMIHAIINKHGNDMDIYLNKELGYGVDKLTQGEAGHIRKAQDVEQIRNRIFAAKHKNELGLDGEQLHKAAQDQEEQQIISEAGTQQSVSILPDPPSPSETTFNNTASEQAVFFRHEDTETVITTINSIELDSRQKPEITVTDRQPKQQIKNIDEEKQIGTSTKYKQTEASAEQKQAEASAEQKQTEASAEQKQAEASAEQKQTEASAEQKQAEASAEQKQAEASAEQKQSEASAVPKTKQPITDLKYKAPPDHLASRYIVANGQYLSSKNGTTVLFEDKGKKISTARTDAQTVRDMLEVAKAKSWDSIKLSGSQEFKSMMYVAAESQGIRTRGYKPTAADLALVEKLRTEQSLNSIEPDLLNQEQTKKTSLNDAPKKEFLSGERLIAHGEAPYLHVSKNQNSYYVTLEKDGKERTIWGVGLADAIKQAKAKIGDTIKLEKQDKQPVTIQIPEKNQDGQIIGQTEKQVVRNLFLVEVLQHNNPQPEPVPTSEPGKSPGYLPEQSSDTGPGQPLTNEPGQSPGYVPEQSPDTGPGQPLTNEPGQSPGYVPEQSSDTGPGQPLTNEHEQSPGYVPDYPDQLSNGELMNAYAEWENLQANAETDELNSPDNNSDNNVSLQTDKQIYMDKASKLNSEAKAQLTFYEKATIDAIRGLDPESYEKALQNYYQNTVKYMAGSHLNMPRPMQIPSQDIVQQQQQQQHIQPTSSASMDPEIER